MEDTPSKTPDNNAVGQAASAPVMDIAAPRKGAAAAPMAVAEPPASAEDSDRPQMQPATKAKQKPVAPKQPRSGVGAAIFATVVIVIALAALATYAYLKQQNKL